MTLLALRGIAVRAADREILAVDALEVAPGETVAVLGANGAGKSTLLRVAGGLRAFDAGEVRLRGEPATAAALRAATAAVLQRPLLRRGSVRANVETGLRFRRVERGAARRRGDAWMERLGLTALADRSAGALSGGEAQRVSLARALALEPALLLLDEPFGALDAPTRAELLADLRDVLAETGTAALLVTHDRHEAAAVADRTAVLVAGRPRQSGATAEVLDRPADADCARLLGFDTVLPAEAAARLTGEAGAHEGEVALRARDIGVASANHEGAAARLRRILPWGAETRVLADLDGVRVTASAPAPPPAWLAALRPGAPLSLTADPAALRPLGGEPAAAQYRTEVR